MDYQKVAEGACAKIEEAVAKFAFKGSGRVQTVWKRTY